jgi:hypothetical protein
LETGQQGAPIVLKSADELGSVIHILQFVDKRFRGASKPRSLFSQNKTGFVHHSSGRENAFAAKAPGSAKALLGVPWQLGAWLALRPI